MVICVNISAACKMYKQVYHNLSFLSKVHIINATFVIEGETESSCAFLFQHIKQPRVYSILYNIVHIGYCQAHERCFGRPLCPICYSIVHVQNERVYKKQNRLSNNRNVSVNMHVYYLLLNQRKKQRKRGSNEKLGREAERTLQLKVLIHHKYCHSSISMLSLHTKS